MIRLWIRDFSWYLEAVSGAMARLDVSSGRGPQFNLHQPRFDLGRHPTALESGLDRGLTLWMFDGIDSAQSRTALEDTMSTARVRARERVIVNVDSRAARWIGAVAVLMVFCWLLVVLAGDHHHPHWQAAGRLAWSLTVLAGVALIARGIFLGRPVTAAHAATAMVVLLTGLGAHVLSFALVGNVLIAGAGLVLMWPTAARPQPDALPQVWALVDATHGDPLAPFAMHSLKSYHFNSDKSAAIAYRTRIGFAVVRRPDW